MSLAKQNFSNVVEDALNQQISLEMTASQTYLAIAAYMGSDTVALPGLEKYFHEQSEEVIVMRRGRLFTVACIYYGSSSLTDNRFSPLYYSTLWTGARACAASYRLPEQARRTRHHSISACSDLWMELGQERHRYVQPPFILLILYLDYIPTITSPSCSRQIRA